MTRINTGNIKWLKTAWKIQVQDDSNHTYLLEIDSNNMYFMYINLILKMSRIKTCKGKIYTNFRVTSGKGKNKMYGNRWLPLLFYFY